MRWPGGQLLSAEALAVLDQKGLAVDKVMARRGHEASCEQQEQAVSDQ